MKASYLTEYGPPEVLTDGDLPHPDLAPGEALIRVRATALNHLGVWRRSGSRGGLPAKRPQVLGAAGPTFPLADAAEAHRRMGARDIFGKLVLVPDQP